VLNEHPNVTIRGENYNALVGLWHYFASIQDSANRHHSGKPDHPWFGTARLNPEAVLTEIQEQVVASVLRPKSQTQWTGFKEVRYEKSYFQDSTTLLSYLLFLQELLPGLAFLFNTRNPESTVKSGWWRSNPEALHVLEETHINLLRVARELGGLLGENRVQVLNHDGWKSNPRLVVRALANLEFPVQENVVTNVLSTQLMHGKNPRNVGPEGERA
jgi:hypothetical protein